MRYVIYIFLCFAIDSCGTIGRLKKPPTSDISFEKIEARIKKTPVGIADSLVVTKGAKKVTTAIPHSNKIAFHITSIGFSRVVLYNNDLSKKIIFSTRDWTWSDIKTQKPLQY
jgi:hypothetical protein